MSRLFAATRPRLPLRLRQRPCLRPRNSGGSGDVSDSPPCLRLHPHPRSVMGLRSPLHLPPRLLHQSSMRHLLVCSSRARARFRAAPDCSSSSCADMASCHSRAGRAALAPEGGGVQHPPCQGPQDPRWLRRLLARSSLLPRLPCCLRACSPQRPRSPRCLLIRRYLERPPCRDPRWPRRLLAHSPLLLRLPRRLHTCSPRHPRSPRRLLIRRYLERVSRSRYSASGGRCPGWSCCGGYSRQSAPR